LLLSLLAVTALLEAFDYGAPMVKLNS